MTVEELIDLFEEAATIEKMLPDRDRKMLDAKSGWPDYLYDMDDRKDQEPTYRRSRPSAKQIDLLERVRGYLNILGMRTDLRTVMGKKIIWARSNRCSYREIAGVAGIPPTTCERWYKQDMAFMAKKINFM